MQEKKWGALWRAGALTLMRSSTPSFNMGIQPLLCPVLAFLQLPKHLTGQTELSLVSTVNQPRSPICVTYIPPKQTKPTPENKTITKWPENRTTYSVWRLKWVKGKNKFNSRDILGDLSRTGFEDFAQRHVSGGDAPTVARQ